MDKEKLKKGWLDVGKLFPTHIFMLKPESRKGYFLSLLCIGHEMSASAKVSVELDAILSDNKRFLLFYFQIPK